MGGSTSVQCGTCTCIHSTPSLIPPPHLHPHTSRVQTTDGEKLTLQELMKQVVVQLVSTLCLHLPVTLV